jgi:hypothetical protein
LDNVIIVLITGGWVLHGIFAVIFVQQLKSELVREELLWESAQLNCLPAG